jgi:hypothetical protein
MRSGAAGGELRKQLEAGDVLRADEAEMASVKGADARCAESLSDCDEAAVDAAEVLIGVLNGERGDSSPVGCRERLDADLAGGRGLVERGFGRDLRHSFASLLLHEVRSVIYVARQLGHDARLTLSTYGHVMDDVRGYAAARRADGDRRRKSGLGRGRNPELTQPGKRGCPLPAAPKSRTPRGHQGAPVCLVPSFRVLLGQRKCGICRHLRDTTRHEWTN